MRRTPIQLWLLAIAAFAVPMMLAFWLSSLVRHAKSGVVSVDHEDPELEVAIETARRSLPKFEARLQKPEVDEISFAIRARIVQGNHAEQLWVDHLTYDNGVFTGSLADAPVLMAGMHKGDPIKVPQSEVVDWLILHQTPSGELREGDETDRVLRRRQEGHALRYPRRMPSSTARSA